MLPGRQFAISTISLCVLWPLWSAPAARADLPVLETPHYRIHTDLDRPLSEDFAVRLEAMFEDYSRRLADFTPPSSEKFQVYLFTRRDDYSRLTGDRFPSTGGIFIPRRSLLAGFLESQGRDGLRQTLQHEAFHQFAHTAIGPQLPVWLNEGIAQIFEDGIWNGQSFMLGQVPPYRIRKLHQDMDGGKMMSFRRFIALGGPEWRKGLADSETAGVRYSQAWAMVHFLIYASDDAAQPRYRPRLIEMLRLIHAGIGGEQAFVQAFSDNYDGFQSRFGEYARTLKPTPEARYIEQQSVLAELLVALRSRRIRFDDVDRFRQSLVRNHIKLPSGKQYLHWDPGADISTYFCDVLGRQMDRQRFYFERRADAPLPDLVSRPMDHVQFRTSFYDGPDRVDYETLVQSW